jgi:AcrR family transcriptional regulator
MAQRAFKQRENITDTSSQGQGGKGGLRDGAAIIPKGRERVETILDAARHIIVLDGYGNFTMRKVAAKAGVSLGNLQYYFSDKGALLRELLKYLNQRYDHDYATIAMSGDPVEQLFSFIDYVLADGRKPLVRGLYWQFWALSSNDDYIFKCMERTYVHYRKALAAVIKAVNPSLDSRELRLRSTVIQSMIEGSQLSLVVRNGELVPPRGLSERIRFEALRIVNRPLGRRRTTASSIRK